MPFYNPFARRDSHGQYPLTAYRILVPLSWALVVVIGIYYSVHKPHDVSHGHNIWSQLERRFTAFSVNATVVEIYWIILLLSQIFYVFQLFNQDDAVVALAANAASHFILNNLFIVAWLLLWTRSHFWPAEIFVVASFINQHLLFWRVRSLPPVSHVAVVAGPYAWSLIALFWGGAAAVSAHNAATHISANIFLWIIFLIGSIHIFLATDDLLGYSLSLLTFGLAVAQTSHKSDLHLQWIFAWVIFGVFLLDSLYITSAKYSGRDVFLRAPREADSGDAERAPLLNDSAGPAS
ncbi:DUF1774 domain-containing protein [Aspergillus mulundensis]|uniref:DUF1774-domain-containing protein n=1 Tax=Aspergillus mulundensis TaxID=1810919 RepID=A0A3D8QZQ8_9EURO|nr:Uncharacterized protein DSM5745_09017 [Aspergillus mulundensis]RDW67151.1 Uncharacterized protein DSM5745_09017 [Aspergillus mulundensis]